MKNYTYYNSQSFRTLTHWQSSTNVPEWDTIAGAGNTSFIGLKDGEGNYYPFPGGWKLPGAVKNLDGQVFSETFNFNALKYKKGGYFQNDNIFKGVRAYIGRYSYDVQKLEAVPVEYTDTDEMTFTYASGSGNYWSETGDEMTKPVAIPTLKRDALVYAWTVEGYENNLPSWLNTTDFTEFYAEYTEDNPPQSVEEAPCHSYTYSGDAYPVNIANGLNYASVKLVDNADAAIKVPHGYTLYNDLRGILYSVSPALDPKPEKTGVFGVISGIEATSAPYVMNTSGTLPPANEAGVIIDGTVPNYSAGTFFIYPYQTYQRTYPLKYSVTSEGTWQSITLNGNNYRTFTPGIIGGIDTTMYRRYFSYSYNGQHAFLPSFVSKSFYNDAGEQVGAVYLTILNIVTKIEVEQATIMQRSTE